MTNALPTFTCTRSTTGFARATDPGNATCPVGGPQAARHASATDTSSFSLARAAPLALLAPAPSAPLAPSAPAPSAPSAPLAPAPSAPSAPLAPLARVPSASTVSNDTTLTLYWQPSVVDLAPCRAFW